jgi:hypothetical protein
VAAPVRSPLPSAATRAWCLASTTQNAVSDMSVLPHVRRVRTFITVIEGIFYTPSAGA